MYINDYPDFAKLLFNILTNNETQQSSYIYNSTKGRWEYFSNNNKQWKIDKTKRFKQFVSKLISSLRELDQLDQLGQLATPFLKSSLDLLLDDEAIDIFINEILIFLRSMVTFIEDSTDAVVEVVESEFDIDNLKQETQMISDISEMRKSITLRARPLIEKKNQFKITNKITNNKEFISTLFKLLTNNCENLPSYCYNITKKRWEYFSKRLKRWKKDTKNNIFIKWMKLIVIPLIKEYIADSAYYNGFIIDIANNIIHISTRIDTINWILELLMPVLSNTANVLFDSIVFI